MTTAVVVIYFFFFAFIIGLPVFFAAFLAAAIPAAPYPNFFFPTIGIMFLSLVRWTDYHNQQSHLRKAKALRVGLPFESFIGPGIPPMRAQNDLRRAADLGDFFAWAADTGGFRFMPCALADARPLAFSPPAGFLPSLRCHAGVLAMSYLQ
jgi:energy-coupling factor transporter transmembrane protein EcfT